MGHGRTTAWIADRLRLAVARFLWLAVAIVVAASCGRGGAPADPEHIGEAASAVFANPDFETGAAGMPPPSWPVTPYLNPINTGITIATPETRADLNLQTMIAGHAPPQALTVIMASAGGPLSQPDPYMGPAASLRWPRFGNQCALVNNDGRNENVNSMAQTMTVGAGDVDPMDGKVHIRFVVAPVLENPNHPPNQQPYFFIQATNVTQGNAILYSNFNFSNQAGVPWKTQVTGGLTFVYTDWQLIDIVSDGTTIQMGDQVQLEFIAAGCSQGAHMGQLYVDAGNGAALPGLFISGKGPAQVNPCGTITYNLSYQNGSAVPAANVVITFNTPPGTTYNSSSTPGLVCMTPTAGTAGTITCTLAALPAGAGGTLSITVNVPCTAMGVITAGDYTISATGVTPILGNVINTIVGCTNDSQCLGGTWCDESANQCLPKLGNGKPIPNDPPHMGPTLNGTCTAPAATLVCQSGVCDTADNECGYANGDGPCTMANGGTVCRSAVCDVDNLCGYANGDGPCTPATGPVVCRSGACSVNGLCEPAGGCNVDADCTGGKWCNEAAHLCTPQLPNGQPIPSDPPHTGPTLNGTCTTPAATLVCQSGVCDTNDNECGYANGDGPCNNGNMDVVCRSQVCDANDGKCGYANGDGPCTMANGGTVCRSGMCSTNGLCEPAGGCNVDADCSGGNWCNETAHMCSPKLANGTAIPSDAPHTNPTLNGTCTMAAAMLVCQSGVCDTNDNKCGYADGDGPCTMMNGGTVCRSMKCSTNGTCEPMNGCNTDADCSMGNWCNETAHMCSPQLANGQPVPTDGAHMNPTLNGTCTSAAGMLTCKSGVCDTKDNECGYANGDGPCTGSDGDVVCRSGICATMGMNMGTCVACVMDSQCTAPTATCDMTSNTCVQCTTSAQCMMPTPVCSMGKCVAGCNVDADCMMGTWCNETTHMCTPTVPNGMPVPSDSAHTNPTLNGMCTPDAGKLTCQSGVCDPKDNECGLADGDGTCTDNAQCRNMMCNTTSMTCVGGCTTDADCNTTGDPNKTAQFCDTGSHTCKPKLPDGQMCEGNNQCVNGDCAANVCSSVIGSGNGLICGARPGSPASGGGAGLLGLALAAAAVARRRRAALRNAA